MLQTWKWLRQQLLMHLLLQTLKWVPQQFHQLLRIWQWRSQQLYQLLQTWKCLPQQFFQKTRKLLPQQRNQMLQTCTTLDITTLDITTLDINNILNFSLLSTSLPSSNHPSPSSHLSTQPSCLYHRSDAAPSTICTPRRWTGLVPTTSAWLKVVTWLSLGLSPSNRSFPAGMRGITIFGLV